MLLHIPAGCPPFYYPVFAKSPLWDGLAGTPACSWLSQVNTHCQGDVLSLETAILLLLVTQKGEKVPPWPENRLTGREGAQEQRASRENIKRKQNQTPPLLCGFVQPELDHWRQPPVHLFIIRCLMHNKAGGPALQSTSSFSLHSNLLMKNRQNKGTKCV